MVRRREKFPQRFELVLGKVKRVNPFSVFISLTEYPVEGMVHISEVANKWIRDIREFAKVGDNVVTKVMRIDEQKGHIALSLKRVSKRDKEDRMKQFKRDNKAEKMLTMAARELGKDLDQAYDEVGYKLIDEFGEMFEAFRRAQTPDGKQLMEKRGFPKDWIEVISKIAEKALEAKETMVKLSIDMTCFEGNGVEIIKKSLKSVSKDIYVRYISAPRYMLEIKSKDAKKARKKLEAVVQKLVKETTEKCEINVIE